MRQKTRPRESSAKTIPAGQVIAELGYFLAPLVHADNLSDILQKLENFDEKMEKEDE